MKFCLIFVATLIIGSSARFTQIGYKDDQIGAKRNRNSRIRNGQPADISYFPYTVALLDLTKGGFICGASIIGIRWILSAAHCLEFNTPTRYINFRAGSTNRMTGGTIYIAASYYLHPRFNTISLEYDVAVVRTTQNMGGINIKLIPLPPSCGTICCSVCKGVMTTSTGWGRNEVNALPLNLVQLTKPVHEFNDCQRIWTEAGGPLTEETFCKASFDGKDTCDGDSGGPVVVGQGEERIQAGIISFGSEFCGDGLQPSVNVRIEHPGVRSWINSMTNI